MKTPAPPLVPLFLPIALASCAPDAPDARIVFRDVRVFDGHEVHERTTVVVADDRSGNRNTFPFFEADNA